MTATPAEPAPQDLPEDAIEIGTSIAADVDPEEIDH